MTDAPLGELGSSLSDSFYDGMAREALLAGAESRGAGRRLEFWGIRDPGLIERLESLGVTTDTVAALALTPLVAAAWADGNADPREREAVLQAAEQHGLRRRDVSYLLLEARLKQLPPTSLFEAWVEYVGMLADLLPADVMMALRRDVMEAARTVAEASGGLLGLGSRVSRAELEVLDELERAFS